MTPSRVRKVVTVSRMMPLRWPAARRSHQQPPGWPGDAHRYQLPNSLPSGALLGFVVVRAFVDVACARHDDEHALLLAEYGEEGSGRRIAFGPGEALCRRPG